MYTITKQFEFCASHQLEELEEGHPCMRVHGHNYVVTVEMKCSCLNRDGFILDYRKMEPIKTFIDNGLDHRHLNDFWEFQPSAENIAKHLFDHFKKNPDFGHFISAVTVSETPKTSARYEE